MLGARTAADDTVPSLGLPERGGHIASWVWVTVVLIAIPVVCFVLLAWRVRWMSDDGFINVRIVQQILHGNGPVFNAGERVEAGTSPAWIALLVLGRPLVFWLPIEWEAVVFGFATTIGAFVCALMASRRLFETTRLVPFGLLAYLALPPSWEYTTSGLENGLNLLWIAAAQLCLVSVWRSATRRSLLVAAVVIGLAPLVRPDFIVLGVVYAVGVLWIGWRQAREMLGRLALTGLAIPAVYQLFRMAYYGALVPNPVYAKSGASSWWSQGWYYLTDFVTPYLLWIPVVVIAGWFVANRRRVGRRTRVALLTPIVASTIYGILVVRGGGSHMHARLLLPVLFSIALPVFAVPLTRANALLAAGLGAWAIIPLMALGPPYRDSGPHWIENERTVWMADGQAAVALDDFAKTRSAVLVANGHAAAEAARRHDRALLLSSFRGFRAVPLDPSVPYDTVISASAIGMVSVAAGPDVYVEDHYGLGDPFDARTRLQRRTHVDHEKFLRNPWIMARFMRPNQSVTPEQAANIEAARAALTCPAITRLFDRARADMSVGRAVRNIIESVTDFGVSFDPDPQIAARC